MRRCEKLAEYKEVIITDMISARKILIENRLLRNSEEIELFENAIENILNEENYEDIKYLCEGFDDCTEDDEVMFGLVHAIESYDSAFDSSVTMKVFVNSIPDVIPYAKEWMKTMLKRILNDEHIRRVLNHTISDSDDKVKTTFIQLLNEISNENPERFKLVVNEVLE